MLGTVWDVHTVEEGARMGGVEAVGQLLAVGVGGVRGMPKGW